MITIKSKKESWKIAGTFRISHGTYSDTEVIVTEVLGGGLTGRGECRPYARYGETQDSVLAEIETAKAKLQGLGADDALTALQSLLPAGAARNALDCGLWDLKCKTAGKRIWELLDFPAPRARITAFTLSIDTPAKMARAARAAKDYPVLKLKIGGPEGLDAAIAVMQARADAQIILDANEALSPADIPAFQKALAPYPVLMVEQPLKAAEFDAAALDPQALPIFCADESSHTSADLQKLWDAGYRAVNVKLDKCGGITEGAAMIKRAKAMGFVVMCGCMVGTSLAMAPMMALTALADVIDLDGPLLLAKDRENGLQFVGPMVHPPAASLWG